MIQAKFILSFSFAVLLAVGLITTAFVARAEGQDVTRVVASNSGSDIGPVGTQVTLYGQGFDSSVTADWGFGRKEGVVATGPSNNQAFQPFNIGRTYDIEGNPYGEVPSGGQGWISIKLSNEDGSSDEIPFLLAPHTSACYYVDDLNDPVEISPVSCTDPSCNAGACEDPEEEPTPTPTPSPSSTPTPTPKPSTDDDDEDVDVESDSSSSSGSSGSSGSSSSSTGRVAGTSVRQGPSAADRAAKDFIQNHLVVSTVESLYQQIYGRPTTLCTSHYWKIRARSDKATKAKLRGAMAWQRLHGKNPVFASCYNSLKSSSGSVAGASTGGKITAKDINRLYRLSGIKEGANPTPEENVYWISRIKDKPTESAMLGAMRWHALNG